MAEPPAKRRRTQLSFEQKQDIVDYKSKHASTKQEEIAVHFSKLWDTKIGRSTVSDILKNQNKIQSSPKSQRTRHRSGANESLEKALQMWFSDVRSKNVCISDLMLIDKAKQLGTQIGVDEDFKYSKGWIQRFKSRHGIKHYVAHGEAGGVNMELVSSGRAELKETLELYEKDDIYNLDETGLFYRLGPNSTLASAPVRGTKRAKDRISVALCSNASGTDKRKPFVIGKVRRPRCFGKTFDPNIYVKYSFNKKAWMTLVLFQEWLKTFDRGMRLAGRKVVLLVDNASSHSDNGLKLTNTELRFLPPNTTSHIQPMDAGIIRNFKCHYKKLLCAHFLECIEQNTDQTVNIKLAIAFVKQSWERVTPETIQNCWQHVDILPEPSEDDLPLSIYRDSEEDIPLSELRQLMQQLPLACTGEQPLSAEEFLNLDNSAETGDHLDDDSIIKLSQIERDGPSVSSVSDDGDDDDDDDDDEKTGHESVKTVKKTEVRNSIRTMIAYFEQHGSHFSGEVDQAWNMLNAVNSFTEHEVQTTIKDFFKQ